jgi:hypothetical protein
MRPPPAADDVEMQIGYRRSQLGHGGQRIFNLLVRHQP